MTSIVSSLKQRLSLDSRISTPRTAGSLPSSPSFSDFSLGAEQEAEYELWKAKSRKNLEQAKENDSEARKSTWPGMIEPSAPRDIPKTHSVAETGLGQPQQASKRRPEGKIHGMSYYDYHDIIRSASL